MIKVNGEQINPTLFPDGTSQVWKLPEKLFERNHVWVEWKFDRESEFMHVAQIKHLFDSKGVKVALNITYLPYARQDKEISNKTTFALSTFARLLNSLNFETIQIKDPHSEEALNKIANSWPNYPVASINYLLMKEDYYCVCYPDEGALNKYNEIYNLPYVYFEKDREQSTGKILEMKLSFNKYTRGMKDKNILIIDDICDGGGTFAWAATELYNIGVKNVDLFVTHGIFSQGLRKLKEAGIRNIYDKDGECSEHQGYILRKKVNNE